MHSRWKKSRLRILLPLIWIWDLGMSDIRQMYYTSGVTGTVRRHCWCSEVSVCRSQEQWQCNAKFRFARSYGSSSSRLDALGAFAKLRLVPLQWVKRALVYILTLPPLYLRPEMFWQFSTRVDAQSSASDIRPSNIVVVMPSLILHGCMPSSA
jgi:hypothetical protein